MKKTKITFLSIVGLLLVIPFTFTSPVKAETPSYVGVAVGEYYRWDYSIYYDNFDQWFNDSMTANFDTILNHTVGGPTNANITNCYNSWITSGAAPQAGIPADIELILAENTTTGRTGINGTGGYLVLNYIGQGYDLLWDFTWTVANDTENFAAQSLASVSMTTPDWIIYSLVFAPKNVNWTQYVEISNAFWGTLTGYFVYATVTEITNGFSIYVPAGGWWSNTVPITINTTYVDGILDSYTFDYGTDRLFEVELSIYDDGDPLITAGSEDFNVTVGYSDVTINWTATDLNPNTYKVTQDGTQVGSPHFWASGTEIQWAVPEDLEVGEYVFVITVLDDYDNSDTDTVTVNVVAAPAPVIPGYDISIILGITILGISVLSLKTKKKHK
ncbi:MAG: Loki-CTERM sorting domain-containing protein [Promethearchaeota archaeon]